MSPDRICPDCGAEIPPDAPEGLCPRCLAGLAVEEDGATEAGAVEVTEID